VTADRTNLIWLLAGFLCVAVVMLQSCNARVDGCLDPEAANFDVTVDRNDASLCTYPDLLLGVTYVYGDTSFSRDCLYENDLGQSFALTQLYILFSQFQLTGEDIGRRQVINEVDWLIEPANVTSVANDFTFVDNLAFVFPLGMWNSSDMINEMRFTVGVPDSLTPTNIDSLALDNKLNDSRTMYNVEQEQFATAGFTYVRDSLEGIPETVVVSSGPLSYDYPLSKSLRPGEDDTVRVKVDFELLFGDTDLSLDSATIASQLSDRLESAILNNN